VRGTRSRSQSTLVAVLVVLCLVVSTTVVPAAAVQTSTDGTETDTPVCAGHQSTAANGITVVSVQGARFGDDRGKEPTRLVAFGPRGETLWTFDSSEELGVVWSYDVDPLGNGNLFVTATRLGTTLLYELDTETGEPVSTTELPYTDTHDADPLNRTHVVIANMRNYDADTDTNNDRIVVYDTEDEEVDWTWSFDDYYDRDVGGDYTDDWTHVNDVDRVGDDFLLSPRNFDQVVLVDRETGEIERTLGRDDDYDTLHEQHNPDALTSDDGKTTFLVADSENDRIVEYEHADGEWDRTWRLGSRASFDWPRDADRLRNGHTLVGDSKNNRVVEVTPRGEVVWEVYAPWLVYDVERVPVGGFASDAYADLGGSRGPTTTDLRASGSYDLSGPGAAPPAESELTACADALDNHTGGFGTVDLGGTATPTPADTDTDATRTATGDTTADDDMTTTGDATATGDATTTQADRTDTATPFPGTEATPLPGTEATPVPTTEPSSGVVTPGLGVGAVVLAVLLFVGLRRRE